MVRTAPVGLLAALLAGATVATVAPPAPAQTLTIERPVTDRAGVLSAAEIDTISDALVAYRAATGIQLAVVLVDSTDRVPIDDYAQRLFTAWAGGSAERDDGALFVLAINDRTNRLHLGYGLEGHVSDSRALGMLVDLRPALRAGDYGRACLELIEAMRSATRDITPGEPIRVPWPRQPISAAIVLILAILATVLVWRFAFPDRFSAGRRAYDAALANAKGTPRAARKLGRVNAATAFDKAMTRAGRIQLAWSYAVLLLLVPLVLGLVTMGAIGSFVAYPALWLTGCAIAGFGVLIWRLRPIGRWFWLAIVGLLLAVFVGGPSNMVVDDGGEVVGVCFGLLALIAFLSMFWLIDGSGGGGGGGSYSSSSSSSSSWSSSSSSSSSSSWSGGGGSSGGGGASSSW